MTGVCSASETDCSAPGCLDIVGILIELAVEHDYRARNEDFALKNTHRVLIFPVGEIFLGFSLKK